MPSDTLASPLIVYVCVSMVRPSSRRLVVINRWTATEPLDPPSPEETQAAPRPTSACPQG